MHNKSCMTPPKSQGASIKNSLCNKVPQNYATTRHTHTSCLVHHQATQCTQPPKIHMVTSQFQTFAKVPLRNEQKVKLCSILIVAETLSFVTSYIPLFYKSDILCFILKLAFYNLSSQTMSSKNDESQQHDSYAVMFHIS